MKIDEFPVGTAFDEDEINAIRDVIQSGVSLTRGPQVEEFEKKFAEYIGCKYAIATSSCGAALTIANQLLHLTEDDEVIVQANVFWVTIVNLLERKVKIKVADIDPYTLNIDPNKIEELITSKTKAILLMHHGGNPADLDKIRDIAREHNLIVIEDSAHAAGSEYHGNKIGYDSDIACFSFSTLKNMSTLGEGGMLVTNNEEYYYKADKLRTNWPLGNKIFVKREKLGDYQKPKSIAFMHAGDAWDYDWESIEEFGSTYRLSTPQAAVGIVQLKKLDHHNKIRRNIATWYDNEILKIDGLRLSEVLTNCKNSYHLYTFFVDPNQINRDELVKCLEQDYDVHTFNRFWPVHLGGIMRFNGHRLGEAPVCERIWFKEQMSLPIYPTIEDDALYYVIDSLEKAVKRVRK